MFLKQYKTLSNTRPTMKIQLEDPPKDIFLKNRRPFLYWSEYGM